MYGTSSLKNPASLTRVMSMAVQPPLCKGRWAQSARRGCRFLLSVYPVLYYGREVIHLPQIRLEAVSKRYVIAEREPGLAGALRGLVKRKTRIVQAVDDVSFSLEPGELVGYIGPNGAGKSTTIKLMSGILCPDSGVIDVMGRTPWKQRRQHVAHIGVVFGQKSQLWWDTPAIDSFELLRDIYRVGQTDYKRRLDELCDRLDAGSILHTPVRQMSLGQRMKCEVIASLLHGPEILFLDEPTIGLDAVTRLAVRDFLIGLNRREGVTMILTTHDMDDVEALCRRVMVIGRGKLLFDGGMDDLRGTYAPNRLLKVRLGADVPLQSVEGAEKVEQNGRDVTISFRPEKTGAEKMIARIAALAPIADLTVESADMEQVIADMYRELKL